LRERQKPYTYEKNCADAKGAGAFENQLQTADELQENHNRASGCGFAVVCQ
jgi:hypothetical protein